MTKLGHIVFTIIVFALVVFAYLFGVGATNYDWRQHAEAQAPRLYEGVSYLCQPVVNELQGEAL